MIIDYTSIDDTIIYHDRMIIDQMIINRKIIDICSKNAPAHNTTTNRKLSIPPKRRTLIKSRKRINHKINMCKHLKPMGHLNKIDKLNKKKSKLEIQIRDSIREEAVKREIEVIKKIKTNPELFLLMQRRKVRLPQEK